MKRVDQLIDERGVGNGSTETELYERASRRRRSRMHRQGTRKRIALSDRDIEIFRLLDRYRYLRSTYLHGFLGGNRKRFIERLGDLFHEGYIGRPGQQWQFANSRYMPAIYGLDSKGCKVLDDYGLRSGCNLPPSQRHRGVSRQFAHQLMICDVLASIELGVRAHPALRFIDRREILDNLRQTSPTLSGPFRISVSFTYSLPGNAAPRRVETAIVPDGIFGLEYDRDGLKSYRFFALEADRGQMPVTRRDFAQSSYLKKLLAYQEIARQKLFKSALGLPNLLVLTVTLKEPHMQSMMKAFKKATAANGSQILLFRALPVQGKLQGLTCPATHLLTDAWERCGHNPFRICDP